MINMLNLNNFFYSFLIFLISLNITILEIKEHIFQIKISKSNSELEFWHIDYDKTSDPCKQWIPSLFSPILLIPFGNEPGPQLEKESSCTIRSPIFSDKFSVNLYNFSFLDAKYNVTLGMEKTALILFKCYFGLSYEISGFEGLKDNKIILNQLKSNNEIDEKIFSFDKWNINGSDKFITSNLTFGGSNSNFKLRKKGIIGSCESNFTDPYWGCTFDKISLNGNEVDLKDDNNEAYKIYFSSENYTITIPKDFENKFKFLTNQSCTYVDDIESPDYELSCPSLFKGKDYFTIKLINGNMNITIEIDNQKRFTNNDDEKYQFKTRIRYEEKNYFIFPLIMFKNFDIKFDSEKKLVNFFTTDESILEGTKVEEEVEEKGSSNGLKIFLVILIIILIIGLIFAIFWLFKKRRNSIEKNINKYNKFEDEENFQDMNEKRVF